MILLSEYNSMASVYDEMISWAPRLKREIPFLRSELDGLNNILDVACSTGRHAIELAKDKDKFILGIDLNENMITQANSLKAEMNVSNVEFMTHDASKPITHTIQHFDGAFILANTLATLGSRDKIIQFLKHIRKMIPDGKLIGQTVYLDNQGINYLPLRMTEGSLIQRVMFPESGNSNQFNYSLHFNIIKNSTYESRTQIPLYSINREKLEKLCALTGWSIDAMYSNYEKSPVDNSFGKAQIWVLS